MRLGFALVALALTACRQELNERTVRELVDDADHAFLAGHAADICDMRSDDFAFTGSTFELAKGRTVADLAAARAADEATRGSGDRTSGKVVTMTSREFCAMAVEQREAYRRTTLVRTALDVAVSPDGKQASVRAHYIVKSPEYGYNDSTLSAQDRVERQLGTLQTETDEESIVALGPKGKLVFTTTRATSWQFRVPKERDARL